MSLESCGAPWECGVRVKEEPGLEPVASASVKQEAGWAPVKQEPSEAAAAGLYAGHEVKGELVLGPTTLQPPDAAFSSAASQNACMSPIEDKRANNKILDSVESQTNDGIKPKGPPGAGAAREPYSCDGCGKRFAWQWSLMRHIRQNAEKCNLLDHKIIPGKKPVQCDICLKNVSNILVHKRIHTGEKPFECEICLKQFSQSSNLLRHKYLHSGGKPYKCDICLKQFTQSSTLRQHKQIHAVSARNAEPARSPCAERGHSPAGGPRPGARRADQLRLRACSVRLERLEPAADKRAHSTIRGASVERPTNDGLKPRGPPGAGAASELYSCVVPGERCSAPTLISTPERNQSVGSSEESSYNYIQSPNNYSSPTKIPIGCIVEHDHCYTGRRFLCDICWKLFTFKYNLIRHRLVHTGEKPYKCEVCTKQFSRKCFFASHKYVHTGGKPYKCEFCKKQFILNSGLVNHKYYIHTREKPYKCEVCTKQFSRKALLASHKYVHTGEKPYKCENENENENSLFDKL